MSSVTPIFRLNLIAFDTQPWDVAMNANISAIDAIMARYISILNLGGIWTNSAVFTVGQQVIDPVDSSLWLCNVGNTSAASPTLFSADRANNPTWWTLVNTQANAQTAATSAAASATAAASSAAIAGGSNPLNRPIISSTATSITVQPGTRIDISGTVGINLVAPLTKLLTGTWVGGSGNGGVSPGVTISSNSTYHIFLAVINGTSDVFIAADPTASQRPTGTTALARIGSFRTNGSSQIVLFVQNGQRFDLLVPVVEYNAAPGVTTAITQTLTGVPNGIAVMANLSVRTADNSAISGSFVSALYQTDTAPSTTAFTTYKAAPGDEAITGVTIMTNTTQQIRFRVVATTNTFALLTNGWSDFAL